MADVHPSPVPAPTPAPAPSPVPAPTPAPSSGAAGDANEQSAPAPSGKPTTKAQAQAAQVNKLRDANAKYKNLLKMAKERIQQQEEELEKSRNELQEAKSQMQKEQQEAAGNIGMDDGDAAFGVDGAGESSASIVSVCMRVKTPVQQTNGGDTTNLDEIWALIEFEEYNADMPETALPPKRYRRWKRFDTESELSDFIRRDTGEPLTLPPYSLTPEQSSKIQDKAKQEVSQVTEEFRRFRVRSEMARKQAEAHIREMQSTHVQSAQRRIEGHDLDQQLEQARSDRGQLDKLRAEMAEQEAHWKEAYDVLLAENNALKSSGSEALLAAQWRQRYETCMTEKETIKAQLQAAQHKQALEKDEKGKADAGKYEAKYRDLKESFRLYRKKAKEIFEAQQNGDSTAQILNMAERGSEESKLDYLKNLMVNYLTSDAAMRDHMEGAIGTVLQFTPSDLEKIKKKKAESWF